MDVFAAKVEQSGRILIPAAVRRQLGIKEGSEVVVRVDENGGMTIGTRAQAVARIHEQLRRYIPAGSDVTAELIADRRRDDVTKRRR